MAKTVETDKLLEGLTLNDEQRAAMTAILGDEKNLEAFSRRYLRRDEGTRLAQEAAEAKRVAEAAQAKAEKEFNESEAYRLTLTDWEAKKLAELKTKEDAIEAERVRFKAALLGGGIDPESDEGRRLAAQHADQPPAFDPKSLKGQYIDMDMGREIAKQAIELPLQMPAIMARHQKLYGTTEADWAGFQQAAKTDLLTKGISVEATAETFFKFKDKETELATQAIEDRIAREVEDKVNAALSAAKLPGGSYNPNAPTDKLFTEEFAAQTKDSESVQDKRALDHFLVANEELRKAGVTMEY